MYHTSFQSNSLSAANKGNKLSEEHKEKFLSAARLTAYTPDALRKRGKTLRNGPKAKERADKISRALTGRVKSDEARYNVRQAAIAREKRWQAEGRSRFRLTPDEAAVIRARRAEGVTISALSREFGLCGSTLYTALKNKV